MNQEVISDQVNKILIKCWADASFKQKLLADPTAVLKAEGIKIPAGYSIRLLENTDKVINYVLPPSPNDELSDSELESVAGGIVMSPDYPGFGRSQKIGQSEGSLQIHHNHVIPQFPGKPVY